MKKKNIKGLNYKFFKNTILLSSLGICVSCNSNNTVNKHNQDNVKGDSSEYDDEEATDKKIIGSRRKIENDNDSELNKKKSHIEEKKGSREDEEEGYSSSEYITISKMLKGLELLRTRIIDDEDKK